MIEPSNPRIAALDRMLELALLINHDLTTSLAAQGLSTSRVSVLWEVLRRGPVTQRELADALHVTARNMTGLVDGLVAGQLVTREPHPSDRRATLVTLTPKGTTAAQQLVRDQSAFADLLFADLPPAELGTFASVLDHVVNRLNEHGLTIAAARKEEG